MSLQIIKEHILNRLHQDAEYISGGLTWILSFISLNIHFSQFGQEILVKFASGMISLLFTAMAVVLTHFLKKFLEKKSKQ